MILPDTSPSQWAELLGVPLQQATSAGPSEGKQTSFVILADPSFLRIQDLLSGLDYAFPESSKIGEDLLTLLVIGHHWSSYRAPYL